MPVTIKNVCMCVEPSSVCTLR